MQNRNTKSYGGPLVLNLGYVKNIKGYARYVSLTILEDIQLRINFLIKTTIVIGMFMFTNTHTYINSHSCFTSFMHSLCTYKLHNDETLEPLTWAQSNKTFRRLFRRLTLLI